MTYTLGAADIINQGLRAGGLQKRIAEFYEGSEAAKVALEIYGQTRDEIIDSKDWALSRRQVSLTLLKGPPPDGGYNPLQPWSNVYPAPGFLYEYLYPDDCIDLKAIIAPPLGEMPDLDPLPAQWRIDNDIAPIVAGKPPVASGPPAKVILCNTTDAIANYRARVTDPSQWTSSFIQVLVDALGAKFAIAFRSAEDTAKVDLQKEQIDEARSGGGRD